jgi:hypothetical protein
MGDLVRKIFRINYEKRSLAEIEEVAEGAALMQEQHARDVVSMAETAGVGKSDARVKRAKHVMERLR